jgi:hypothetical protein
MAGAQLAGSTGGGAAEVATARGAWTMVQEKARRRKRQRRRQHKKDSPAAAAARSGCHCHSTVFVHQHVCCTHSGWHPQVQASAQCSRTRICVRRRSWQWQHARTAPAAADAAAVPAHSSLAAFKLVIILVVGAYALLSANSVQPRSPNHDGTLRSLTCSHVRCSIQSESPWKA